MEDSLPNTAPVLYVPAVLRVEMRVCLRAVALSQPAKYFSPKEYFSVVKYFSSMKYFSVVKYFSPIKYFSVVINIFQQ